MVKKRNLNPFIETLVSRGTTLFHTLSYALVTDTDYIALYPSAITVRLRPILLKLSEGYSEASSNTIHYCLTPTDSSLNVSGILLLLFNVLSLSTLTYSYLLCQPLKFFKLHYFISVRQQFFQIHSNGKRKHSLLPSLLIVISAYQTICLLFLNSTPPDANSSIPVTSPTTIVITPSEILNVPEFFIVLYAFSMYKYSFQLSIYYPKINFFLTSIV